MTWLVAIRGAGNLKETMPWLGAGQQQPAVDPSAETSGWSVTRKGAAAAAAAGPVEKRPSKHSAPKPSWLNPGTATTRAKGQVRFKIYYACV